MIGSFPAVCQNNSPDLSNTSDLAKLGVGKIIEKDNCVIKEISLKEIQGNGIVYVKNESLHDKAFDYIKRLEFPASVWGWMKIEFVNHKPVISIQSCYR
jgi:hypothetical protein